MASSQDLFHPEGLLTLFTGIVKTNKSYQGQLFNSIRNRESFIVSNKSKIDLIKDLLHQVLDGNKTDTEEGKIFNWIQLIKANSLKISLEVTVLRHNFLRKSIWGNHNHHNSCLDAKYLQMTLIKSIKKRRWL